MLHEPHMVEELAERIGSDSFDDPEYRHIFAELVSLGADAGPELLAQALDEGEVETLQELLADSGGLEQADAIVKGSLEALLSRDLAVRMTEIDRMLPVASDEQKNDLIREKARLRTEMQALGHSRWKSFGRSRS